jgi:hypothetical protein
MLEIDPLNYARVIGRKEILMLELKRNVSALDLIQRFVNVLFVTKKTRNKRALLLLKRRDFITI